MEDAATEEDHAMEYTAHSIQEEEGEEGEGEGEHIYEVTMEEYGEGEGDEVEGEMKDALHSGYIEEEAVMNDAALQGNQGEEEEQYNEDQVDGAGDEEEESKAPTEITILEEVQSAIPAEEDEDQEGRIEVVGAGESEDAEEVSIASTLVKEIAQGVSEKANAIVEVTATEETNGIDEVLKSANVKGTRDVEAQRKVDDEAKAAQEAQEEEGEDSEEKSAPSAIRVTFNGQDFVLFPHSEPSAYISAQDAELVAAPKLKADEHIIYESMDSFFQTLRVKESLGDFLEEGSELQISFVDLDLILREDDVYAREVSLHDINRIHSGYGFTSSLHLVISESVRFITRYNELAAHVSEAVDDGTEKREEASVRKEEEGAAEEELIDTGAIDIEDQEESTRHAERIQNGGEQQGEERVVEAGHETVEEERGEDDSDTKAVLHTIQTHPEGTSTIDETTFITVNETADEEEVDEGEEGEQEQEDIVDYDEAYQDEQGQNEGEIEDEEAQVDENGDAEYEERQGEEEEEEAEMAEEEEVAEGAVEEEESAGVEVSNVVGNEEEEGNHEASHKEEEISEVRTQTGQKRPFDDDGIDLRKREAETTTADYQAIETKRAKTD